MPKKKPGSLRIGTSNVVLPFNKSKFPADYQVKTRLSYYASLFNTVELNSTFYKLPLPATFEKWAEEVPDNFQFSIKLWREITHAKKLVFDVEKLSKFLDAAKELGEKKGCLLVQFPGKITLDYYSEVEGILQELSVAQTWRIALEFRSSTWHTRETYELLDEYGATMVLHDQAKSVNLELNTSADFVYMRFHGPGGDYRGAYPDEFLVEQHDRIGRWLKEGKDVYVYFNNTIGNAFDNTVSLQRMDIR
ncbi:MAG: DUF72 domain-containing protein [Chitinophagaceae bacterium]